MPRGTQIFLAHNSQWVHITQFTPTLTQLVIKCLRFLSITKQTIQHCRLSEKTFKPLELKENSKLNFMMSSEVQTRLGTEQVAFQ